MAAFPNVTAIPIREVLERITAVLDQIALAIRLLAAFSIGAGLIVMAGALGVTRHQRLYQSVILKALGATRGFVARVFAVEYALLGAAAGLGGQRARRRARLGGAALGARRPWRWAARHPRCGRARAPPRLALLASASSAPAAARPAAARRAPQRVTPRSAAPRALPGGLGAKPQAVARVRPRERQRARVPRRPRLVSRRDARRRSARAGRAPSRAASPSCTRTTRSSSWSSRPGLLTHRHRARARAHRVSPALGLPGRAAAARAAVHRPPARPRDVGTARLRQVRGGEADAPGPVRGAHRRAGLPSPWSRARPPREQGTLESRLAEDRSSGCARPSPKARRPSPTTGCSRRGQGSLLELSSAPGAGTRSACSSPHRPGRSWATRARRAARAVPAALPARHAPRLRPSGHRQAQVVFESAPPADWV